MRDRETILKEAKTIAVVGLSSKEHRESNSVAKYLQRSGYRIIPVNPKEQEVLGEKAYASLKDVPEDIDIVDVFRRAEQTPDVAREAAEVGAKVLWLQLGIANDEARRIAEEAGMDVVMDSCIRTEHRMLGV
ncbi:MAG TPA: CoA-binding protein [Actinomycetota bacterium]|nr:CoA-binding protein [Actinomycetota bacterium]